MMAFATVTAVLLNQHVAATLASTAGFGIGVTLGWSSLAGVAVSAVIGWGLSDANLLLGTAIVSAALGSLLLPALIWLERLVWKQMGTNSAIAEMFTLLIVGWIVLCFAEYSYIRLIIGRLLTGLGIGGLLTLVPLYISETVSAVHRDTYIFLFHAMLSTGVSCAYFIATIVYHEDIIPLDRYSVFCTIAVAVAGFLCAFIPASPLQRVEEDETAAREAMRRLGGAETGGAQLVDREIELMRQLARALRTTWDDYKTLKSWKYWRAFMLCACIMALQQLSGASPIFSNALTVFDLVGTGKLTATELSVICGAVQIVSSILAVALVRFIGRGRMLSTSLMGMGFCLMTLFFITLSKGTPTTQEPMHACHDWLPPTLLALYFAAYSLGAGPVAWSLLADSFPLQLRIPSASLIAGVGWLLCLTLSSQLATLVVLLGIRWTLFMLGAFCLFGSVIAHLIMSEAAAKSLANVQEEFSVG